ncbi:MAG: methyltransferase domain-containing protein [Methylicorpusculum sp.]|uniref:class I SAM-dependent methyltransferase n=1 Tax=Methylicorpusculum sp. TaxID=2713644 RepID=UPI0027226119|nr:methyltransferase domain-containing protein [Methylicorpusculum sp.]MDO8843233.1 methyltransferase domain-containing protein [Methylicorpusculum sp.]MDO8940104.1 methyltransferase domain-containing protein [Methylicorpusculum sp.]MDP2202507.1 methyltransferase domain-containing protein [Methylicorpusculum sp.]
MKRNFLFGWYQTPRGKLLLDVEASFIKRSITVSCKQKILQIGGLGWEEEFIDCDLYDVAILDVNGLGCPKAKKLRAKSYALPIQSESIDLILLPHLLEFDTHRFETMREIERVLKPEGHLVIINFNPWSFWVRYQYLWEIRLADSILGHFISKKRVLDWLRLLNFEAKAISDLTIDKDKPRPIDAEGGFVSLFATSYAIRAIKRRYNIIPFNPVTVKKSGFAIAGNMESSQRSQDNV